jgi:hypothetical protein
VLYFGLAMLGNYSDAFRYAGNPDGEKAIAYMMGRAPAALADRISCAASLDLAQQIHQSSESDVPKQLEACLANQASNFVPILAMSGLKQAYQDYLDDKLTKPAGLAPLAEICRSWRIHSDFSRSSPLFYQRSRRSGLGFPQPEESLDKQAHSQREN